LPPSSTLFPYTTLFRSLTSSVGVTIDLTNLDGTPSGLSPVTISVPAWGQIAKFLGELFPGLPSTGFRGIARVTSLSPVAVTALRDRKSTRLNSSHVAIS